MTGHYIILGTRSIYICHKIMWAGAQKKSSNNYESINYGLTNVCKSICRYSTDMALWGIKQRYRHCFTSLHNAYMVFPHVYNNDITLWIDLERRKQLVNQADYRKHWHVYIMVNI